MCRTAGNGERMEKMNGNGVRSIAVRQWKSNLPLWISGTVVSAILVCVAMCLAFQEKGWHIALIVCCTCIALFLIGKKTVCPDSFSQEILADAGATKRQIRSILCYQMAWLYMVSVPLGIMLGLFVRPLLPWA